MQLNVTRSSMPSFEEYCEEIKNLWDTHWLTNMGEKHQKLQAELEEYLGVSHTTLYTNGHLALEGALSGLGFKNGGEVITTPFTFVSTTNAIVRCGLKPVFCDIDPNTYTIDTDKIETLITDKTVAILPVHVYGNICDVEKIDLIAKKHGLKVIYDAAHAFAVKYKGISAACYGDVSMFSFHATKVFNTIEGGCVCYKDDSLVQIFNDLKNFGIHGPEDCEYIGGNAKMNEFQAAMGLCNLRHLKTEIAKRKKVVERYFENLSNVPGLILCEPQKNVQPNYAYFPMVFEEEFGGTRDDVQAALAEYNIFARKYFYPAINETTAYKDYEHGDTPVALHISKRVLTPPLYADLTLEDVDRICDIILSCRK